MRKKRAAFLRSMFGEMGMGCFSVGVGPVSLTGVETGSSIRTVFCEGDDDQAGGGGAGEGAGEDDTEDDPVILNRRIAELTADRDKAIKRRQNAIERADGLTKLVAKAKEYGFVDEENNFVEGAGEFQHLLATKDDRDADVTRVNGEWKIKLDEKDAEIAAIKAESESSRAEDSKMMSNTLVEGEVVVAAANREKPLRAIPILQRETRHLFRTIVEGEGNNRSFSVVCIDPSDPDEILEKLDTESGKMRRKTVNEHLDDWIKEGGEDRKVFLPPTASGGAGQGDVGGGPGGGGGPGKGTAKNTSAGARYLAGRGAGAKRGL